ANTRGRINTPFLFGVGLMDLIPLADLEARADPDDRDGDGISGRLGQDGQGRPARFGRKSGTATLAGFVDEAFRFEMGLTTAMVPDEAQAGDRPGLPEGADPTGEPEVDEGTASLVTDFVRWLAPPAPGTASPADEEAVRQGEALFEGLGCARCHTPQQRTAASAPPPLAGRTFALYSDLLLHDMGPDLESACTAGATATEHRTEPLIGLRYRRRFLHDGRATRVRDAILAHGGEAEAARTAFAALDRVTQEAVLRFLGTL
ncbi:MAG: thiol oxidoreductase, partial [Gemmatimonadetes bacterium]|nr:thiol oxidoreductase [Gemmatimonadota bacterium]